MVSDFELLDIVFIFINFVIFNYIQFSLKVKESSKTLMNGVFVTLWP
jgi:hypothetical protein